MKKLSVFIFYLLIACLHSQAQSPSFRPYHRGKIITRYMVSKSIQGNHAGEAARRRLTIYLPPDYGQEKKRYPVIYLLHGYGGDDRLTCEGIGLRRVADYSILRGHTRAAIIVLPDSHTAYGGSFYTNSTYTGKWADFIAVDVVDYVDKHFRTIPAKDMRGLSGISMGGNGALKIAMLYPGRFGAVYAMTPAVLNWSDGNNVYRPPFKTISRSKSMQDIEDDYGSMLMIDLGLVYSPNEKKPPFFVDLPASYINDSLVIDSAVKRRWEENFPTRMIDQHLDALKGLHAIKLDWGRNDEGKHVPQTCLEFSRKLEAYGIRHFAEEYLGGHAGNLEGLEGRFCTEVLPFFDTYLRRHQPKHPK